MKLKPVLILILLFLLTSCFSEKCECPLDKEVLKDNIIAFEEIIKSDSWTELGLQDYTAFKNDTYRLIIYPSWKNSKISEYTMENGRGKPEISISHYKRSDDTEKTKLEKIDQTEKIELTENDWTEFEELITEQCFWTMPVLSKNMYLDGTGWILEVKKTSANNCSNRNYHIVSRVADSAKYFELCDELLKLAGTSEEEQNSLLNKSWTSD